MFRFQDGKDITQEEFDTIVNPFFDICREHLEKEVVPEYISYFIATGYQMNAIWEDSFDIHVGSALDMFNFDCNDYDGVKAKAAEILCTKYKLKVVCEDPLKFKETQKQD